MQCPLSTLSGRDRPIADIGCITNDLRVTRAKPLTVAAQVSATLGGILWGFAAAYVLIFALSGFMVTARPKVYVTMVIIIGGLATNVLQFKRAETFRPLSTLWLMVVSLSLSAAIVSIFAYMALDLGQS